MADINNIIVFEYENVDEFSGQEKNPRSPLHSSGTFESLRLKQELVDACHQNNMYAPSRIQCECIPHIMKTPPSDIVAQAQTGTGKTATFLLACLNRIDISLNAPQVLIFVHTLELADQILKEARKLGSKLQGFTCRAIVRGDRPTEINEHLVICTFGKMREMLLSHGTLKAEHVFCTVLDEADKMFEIQNAREIVAQCLSYIKSFRPDCQLLFFSATFDLKEGSDDKVMLDAFAPNALKFTLRRVDQVLSNIKQFITRCENRDRKFEAICNIFAMNAICSTIIFVHTKASVDWLYQKISETGRKVLHIHGNIPLEERTEAIERFKKSEYKVLITTDVCSRGLDIPQVFLVINYDPPVTHSDNFDLTTLDYANYDTYLHRIGRTGRFGRKGLVFNFADSVITYNIFRKIADYYNINMQEIDAFNLNALETVNSE